MGSLPHSKKKLPKFKLLSAKKEQYPLGLDIGSHAIKITQVVKSGDGFKLVSLGSAKLPEGSVEDGILQEPEEVARIITNLLNNLKLKEKRVAISISGYSVIVKKVNLAAMEKKDLDEYIQTEVGQYIPFDIEDVYLDYQDLHTNTEDYDRTDVMLVAAKKEVVDGYLSMLQSAGLKVVIVDIGAFALENIYDVNYSLDENVVLVDIGATKMSINIVAKGVSVLARDVVVGSRQLTDQIQNRFGITVEEAEGLKMGYEPVEEKQKDLEEIFANTSTQWALELKKAIDLYYTNNPDMPLNKIVLCGGGSRIQGLDQFLAEEIGLEVEALNPFIKIQSGSKNIDQEYLQYIGPEMAIALGLAIRPSEL
ncbi:MAG: type IV pilus assembly protein PilM [Desulfobulbales bacterium]|nr:type IV pilus assembly protein PilM [Desulfobulbales bacterium]